nr:lipopolysaccharide biosynthesis protein RfbH [uncultured bacterium]
MVIGVGVLGCADIAWRRMLPAFRADPAVQVVAVASRTGDRAAKFAAEFGCAAVEGYRGLLDRDDVDAVYLPLPSGLHATWIRRALDAGKHVLTEKPATTSTQDTASLVAKARSSGLVLMENFMFLHHSRHERVRRLVADGVTGAVRGFHSTFTIPARPAGDIRLDPSLGGGALLDNGAYPVRAAQLLLGPDLTVAGAHLTTDPRHGVDIAGSALLYRSDGVAAQLTFGMDHHYRNDYQVHGGSGLLSIDRAFTPPADQPTEITVAGRGRPRDAARRGPVREDRRRVRRRDPDGHLPGRRGDGAPGGADRRDPGTRQEGTGMRESKALLLEQVRKYHRENESDEFVPGTTPVLSSGAALDEEDRVALVEAALDMRIAAGVSARKFERQFARYFGLRKAHMTNSGSSANLLALSALTSPALEDRRLVPGDEVITVAAGFPTTVNPIIQNGLVPVFVDVELGTYNTTPERIEAAIGPRTRAIMVAHALGNPFAVAEVAEIADRHGLFLVEDNCDAVGSTYRGQLTGTFGDLATVSFYPAHHITTGEGGCVLTSNLALARIVEQLRDWGRDCWCEPGEDNTCRKRFDYQAGTLPGGYDHKYIFSHVGYNLKATDLQAALGLTQLAKVDDFGAARRRNWQRLRDGLEDVPGLLLPSPTPGADPSWFGFVITVLPQAPYTRAELVNFLESCKIGTRRFFGGNLTRHPAYLDQTFRVSGDLANSDLITERTFWVGVYPGLSIPMIDYVVECIREYVRAAGS